MERIINIVTTLGVDLRTRSFFRRDIEKLISEEIDNRIVLNFDGVEFISRSVADEICNVLEDYQNIGIEGMHGDVARMYQVVVNGRRTPREFPTNDIKVVHLKDIKEMEAFFSAF